jgi:hypothetical protein
VYLPGQGHVVVVPVSNAVTVASGRSIHALVPVSPPTGEDQSGMTA